MAIEKKNRKLKTALFIGALVVVFVLLAILMVQTSSQKNAINSRAAIDCISWCADHNPTPGAFAYRNRKLCEKACRKASRNRSKMVICTRRCSYQRVGTRRSNCLKRCSK